MIKYISTRSHAFTETKSTLLITLQNSQDKTISQKHILHIKTYNMNLDSRRTHTLGPKITLHFVSFNMKNVIYVAFSPNASFD